jgi:hypothetical protein
MHLTITADINLALTESLYSISAQRNSNPCLSVAKRSPHLTSRNNPLCTLCFKESILIFYCDILFETQIYGHPVAQTVTAPDSTSNEPCPVVSNIPLNGAEIRIPLQALAYPEGGFGGLPPPPKLFRSCGKAEPNSQFRVK